MNKQADSARRARRKLWFLRARFLVPALVLLAVAGGIYIYLCFHLPVGSGPAGPGVSRENFGNTWTQRRVLLLGLGDSITSGFGATKGHSYFDRLARNPPDEWEDMRGLCLAAVIPNLSVRNLAVPGTNSITHLDRQIASLEVQEADVLGIVVMTTGGNDVIHDYGHSPPCEGAMYGATLDQARPWIASFQARLETMVSRIEEKFPGGCEIFLADIYDPTDAKGVPWGAPFPRWPDQVKILAEYNRVIRELCERRLNVHLVPLHDTFLGHGLCCSRFWERCYRGADPTFWYGANIEDPTERGYDAVRRIFLLEMARVIPQHQ